jgi:hypothetical protein
MAIPPKDFPPLVIAIGEPEPVGASGVESWGLFRGRFHTLKVRILWKAHVDPSASRVSMDNDPLSRHRANEDSPEKRALAPFASLQL